MYTAIATIPTRDVAAESAGYPYIQLLIDTVKILSSYNRHYLAVGVIDENIQNRISEEIARTEAAGEELSAEQIERFNKAAESNRIVFLDDPQRCYDAVAEKYREAQNQFSSATITYSFSTSGLQADAKVDLNVPEPTKPLRLIIKFPMERKDDNWYDNASAMRQLASELISLWHPSWFVLRPAMYAPTSFYKESRSLFKEREQFGWMGYTSKKFSAGTDALALIEPMHEGTFLLLKEDMMTLWPQDIELAHRAEAFLADHDILPVR